MVLVFGESAPKSYAVENTDCTHGGSPGGLKTVEKPLWPFITLFYYLTAVVNKVTGGSPSIESTYVTRDEIRNIIMTGERERSLDEEERHLLQRTLRFTDATAKEVLTPRLDMVAISTDATVEEAIEACIQSGHARLPAYEGSLDNVVGGFDIRNLESSNYDASADLEVADVVTPTLHVPESKNVDDLLSETQENRMHMVIVIDEFGATEGLITIEDVLEEIVGEILVGDEERPIEVLDDDTVAVQGDVNVHELDEALDIGLPEGEEFDDENVTLRAELVDDTRIQKVRVAVDRDTTDPVETEQPGDEGEPQ